MNNLREQFEQNGFVVVENVFDPERDFQPVIDDFALALDDLTEKWYADGKITSRYEGLPLYQRFLKVVFSENSLPGGKGFAQALGRIGFACS